VDRTEILKKLAAGELTAEQADGMLQQVEEKKRGTLYCKVSAKGAVSVYGLQRMPVTLYVEQWDRLLTFGDELRAFLKSHDSELKRKDKVEKAE
jgi:hypothetical protein